MSVFKRALKWTMIVLFLALPAVVWLNYQSIEDWAKLRNYQPPARVSQIANTNTFTDYGKKLFYVNYPELQSKDLFRQNCSDSEKSIVLGCYINGRGIFIFDVNDERLSGVHEVTSAHEMLHAAYERLGESDREEVDAMTSKVFDAMDNKRIKDIIEQYRAKDASIVPNELHSILGTEVRNLSPELEHYYSRYFSNRLVVVQLSENYEQVFTERENQIKAYDNQLSELKKQIDKMQDNLEAQSKDLSKKRSELEQLLASNQTQAYNSSVAGFNAIVASYNAGVKQVKQLIAQYNALVAQRNDVASEEQELLNSIDTRLTPEQAQ